MTTLGPQRQTEWPQCKGGFFPWGWPCFHCLGTQSQWPISPLDFDLHFSLDSFSLSLMNQIFPGELQHQACKLSSLLSLHHGSSPSPAPEWTKALPGNTEGIYYSPQILEKKTPTCHLLMFSPALQAADPLLFTFSPGHCAPRKPLCTSLLLCHCCLQLTVNVKPGEMSHLLCWFFAAPYHIKDGLIRPLTFFFFLSTSRESQHQLPTTKSNDLLKLPSALTPTDHV